jgi:signal transduction histidine kinase
VLDNGQARAATGGGAGIAGGGHGLLGMRERAAALGGSCEAGRAPGGGWRVRARIPIDQEDR